MVHLRKVALTHRADARHLLSAHRGGKGEETFAKYSWRIEWREVLVILNDGAWLRHASRGCFDSTPQQLGRTPDVTSEGWSVGRRRAVGWTKNAKKWPTEVEPDRPRPRMLAADRCHGQAGLAHNE